MQGRVFISIKNWDLNRDTKLNLLDLSWNTLPITTQLTKNHVRKQIVLGVLKGRWNIQHFIRRYGLLGQRIAELRNLQLPRDLESQILLQIGELFDAKEKPIVRLQAMFDGFILPIHVDKTRSASLVIPVRHDVQSSTDFFSSNDFYDQLVDPGSCEKICGIEITGPTLIDTTIPHSVSSSIKIPRSRPRISLTAKWQTCRFADLVRALK